MRIYGSAYLRTPMTMHPSVSCANPSHPIGGVMITNTSAAPGPARAYVELGRPLAGIDAPAMLAAGAEDLIPLGVRAAASTAV